MNPTPQDRFRGALMGSLLGPIYCLQHQSQLPFLSVPPSTVVEERLSQQWNTLLVEGKAFLQTASGKADNAGEEAAPELRLLSILPSLLLGSDWSDGDAFLTQGLLKVDILPGDAVGFSALLRDVEQCLEQTPHHWDLTLARWLNGQALQQERRDDGGGEQLSGQSLDYSTSVVRTCLGCQLLALFWGASQGAQAIPWRAKAHLGGIHPELLQLSDRLYGAWAGQADFEKLGVSCESSLPMATSIL